MALRLRRGTDAERQSVVFQEGELVFVTDTKQLYAGDGSTLGGILVSNVGSPEELTQDLDLNSYNIIGSGVISATAFSGDGSGLTNLELSQLDDINIFAPTNGEVLTYSEGLWINAPATGGGGEGVVTGGDYQINIVGGDSTRIVNSSTNTVTGTLITDSIIPLNNEIRVTNDTGQTIVVNESFNSQSVLILKRNSDADLSALDVNSASIFFAQNDINEDLTYGRIQGRPSGIRINADSTTIFPASTGIMIQDGGNLGIGTDTPATKVEIKDGSLRFDESRTISAIASPLEGEMTYDTTINSLTLYDGVEWRNLLSYSSVSGAVDLPGALVLALLDQTTIDGFGSDSIDITGAVVYNTTVDRVQCFQAGSWLSLPNQDLSEDSAVRFGSVTADSFVSTGAGTPTLESATNLDLQAGNAVRVIGAPFRLANLTTTERNALTPANGDLIYNSTANRIQAYQNGSWINLDDGD